jgi:non-specific serine/threonine protein kinase
MTAYHRAMRPVLRVIAVSGLALVAAACATPRPSPVLAATWSAVADAPVSVTEVAVAAHDGRIWVAGGLRADGSASDEVVVYDPATDAWTAGPRLPEPVHHSALVSTGDGLLLLGGYGPGGPTAAVRRLGDDAAAWVDTEPLPEARAAGAAAFDGTRVVYAGGVGPDALAGEVFVSDGGGWRRLGRLPRAREHLAATSDGAGRTYVLGGRVGGLDGNLAIADLVEGEAVRTIGQLPTPRGGVGAFWSPRLGACLAGGESPGGTNAQVECITADGTVAVLPDLGVARHGVGAAVIDGQAYVVLGGRQPGLFTSELTERLPLP